MMIWLFHVCEHVSYSCNIPMTTLRWKTYLQNDHRERPYRDDKTAQQDMCYYLSFSFLNSSTYNLTYNFTIYYYKILLGQIENNI